MEVIDDKSNITLEQSTKEQALYIHGVYVDDNKINNILSVSINNSSLADTLSTDATLSIIMLSF